MTTDAGAKLLDTLDGFDTLIVSAIAWSAVNEALPRIEEYVVTVPQLRRVVQPPHPRAKGADTP